MTEKVPLPNNANDNILQQVFQRQIMYLRIINSPCQCTSIIYQHHHRQLSTFQVTVHENTSDLYLKKSI